jgi:hypothetical protein
VSAAPLLPMGQQFAGHSHRRLEVDTKRPVVCPPPGSDLASFTNSSVLRELRMSLAPRAASAVAIARPRPPVAPVRSAVLPSRSISGNLPGQAGDSTTTQ